MPCLRRPRSFLRQGTASHSTAAGFKPPIEVPGLHRQVLWRVVVRRRCHLYHGRRRRSLRHSRASRNVALSRLVSGSVVNAARHQLHDFFGQCAVISDQPDRRVIAMLGLTHQIRRQRSADRQNCQPGSNCPWVRRSCRCRRDRTGCAWPRPRTGCQGRPECRLSAGRTNRRSLRQTPCTPPMARI